MRTHRCEVTMACIQGDISEEFVETETTAATSNITRPAHLKRTVPRSRRVWNNAKDVNKNFVDHQESEGHADRIDGPKQDRTAQS